jgi:hypothetical protein
MLIGATLIRLHPKVGWVFKILHPDPNDQPPAQALEVVSQVAVFDSQGRVCNKLDKQAFL